MQVESNIKPKAGYELEDRENNKVAILFFENIKEIKKDKDVIYKYDMYTLVTNKQDNLDERLQSNYLTWLNFAKEQEVNKLSAEIREKRDTLLSATDWTQMQDTALSETKQLEYQKYRQELRDIPEQIGFPYDVIFPQFPSK